MDHTRLLYDIGELNNLFAESISVQAFLQLTVEMVAKHLGADVCSIYLYEEDRQRLVLKATEGLERTCIDRITLRLGEGLTGLALKELKPVRVDKASAHPQYKFFAGSGEENYENFLAVPIRRGLTRIGVLVVQRQAPRGFTEQDQMACQAAASQLAALIENARFLLQLHQENREARQKEPACPDLVRGRTAAPGFAFGRSFIFDRDTSFHSLAEQRFERAYTIEEFFQALSRTETELEELQQRVEETLSDAASLIFATHLLLLKDQEFTGAMRRRIETGENPPRAVMDIAQHYLTILAQSTNPAVREKVQDVEDLALRIMANLLGQNRRYSGGKAPVVLTRRLFPSELLRMASEGVRGIVLATGGATSHLSILARSLGIVLVVAEKADLLRIPDGTPVLIDGDTGNIYINPKSEVVENFQKRNEDRRRLLESSTAVKPQTRTRDGTRVHLYATINLLSDVQSARRVHCEGIGLYRSEFPFIARANLPSEEEQYACYRLLVEAAAGLPLTFRTLDIGGDKVLAYSDSTQEANPCLGMRSIRFSLTYGDVFTQQVRAILRAGVGADLRIMFPMIGSLEEFLQARERTYRCMEELTEQGLPFNPHPKIGMMVELPSVVPLIEDFARHADFFAIGTNDLIQFMLGVDRTNIQVAPFFIPHHPSVLRAIATVAEVGRGAGKEVSVCGDMANQLLYVPFLLGVGIRILSLDAVYVPQVQNALEAIDIAHAEKIARAALRESRTEATEALLREALPEEAP